MNDKNNDCPRCGGLIPNNENPGAFPGAISRLDNKTEICSDCGTTEAILDWIFENGEVK
jgi:ribosomal protein S27AE